MGMHIRDERQMKAFTGLSQAQFNHLLSVFSDISQAIQQTNVCKRDRVRHTPAREPGGGRKSKLPTMADKRLFVLYYYKTYPTFDVRGTQLEIARSKAHTTPLYALADSVSYPRESREDAVS